MGTWTQVGENLVRHQGGTIYLRAKVAGKVIRQSLRTSDLRIAKIARDERLESMRRAAACPKKGSIRTIGDAIDLVEAAVVGQPSIRPATASYYAEMIAILRATLPVAALVRSLQPGDAMAWWKRCAAAYAAQRANNVLGMARRVGAMLVDSGTRPDNPFAHLKRRRIEERELTVPSQATLESIIANIRGMGKSHSEEAANFVAFLAYSGCRVGQARAVLWSDIQGDWILFRGGISGTKGAKPRRLPISEPLAIVLEQIRQSTPKPIVAGAPIFTMKKPHEALANACQRLQIPHLRIHDLRHFFAVWTLESGVDVGTVSKWLGHKDGGVLVLRTYGHLRDEHSAASATRLRPFSKPADDGKVNACRIIQSKTGETADP